MILELIATRALAADSDVTQLTKFVGEWYWYLFLPLGTVLAGIVILIGGIMYASSAGDATKVQKAKELIYGAISGLVLLICAILIINTITPT